MPSPDKSINWPSLTTIVSAAILIGTELLGAAWASGWALAGFFQLGPDKDDNDLAPLGFVCGGYLDQYRTFAGLGEVMVASFGRSDTGVAIVYQEWRGKSFDPSDPKSWPVPTEVVQARANQLKAEVALSKAD